MPSTILGLDIGGANLKAATATKQAVTVPFALWKQPDQLPAVLAALLRRFPETDGLAVTMTGELCDCYTNRAEGVQQILDAVETVAHGRPVGVWSTGGVFVSVAEARQEPLRVASANWHALAMFAGRMATGASILLDVGSTTTDVVYMPYGEPEGYVGMTDADRLRDGCLIYTGVGRTPVCSLSVPRIAAELFATLSDVYLWSGRVPEDVANCATADGRPATRAYAYSRLCRMLGGDAETIGELPVRELVNRCHQKQRDVIADSIRTHLRSMLSRSRCHLPNPRTAILSGSGEFLARDVIDTGIGEPPIREIVVLSDNLGPHVSTAAPAYALAVLATERGLP
ncbi:MAG: hypothetical protein LC104_14475 [Bacteroidales bacterium]|nr:hypothetical protein [Bacteroidales bacterium]